jgi:hypothetical protein
MQHHRNIFLLTPRFPWWGWILLLPLAVLGIFLGAVFFLVFISFVLSAGLVLWLRWKWLARKMGGRPAQGAIYREFQVQRHYDCDLRPLDETRRDRQDQ